MHRSLSGCLKARWLGRSQLPKILLPRAQNALAKSAFEKNLHPGVKQDPGCPCGSPGGSRSSRICLAARWAHLCWATAPSSASSLLLSPALGIPGPSCSSVLKGRRGKEIKISALPVSELGVLSHLQNSGSQDHRLVWVGRTLKILHFQPPDAKFWGTIQILKPKGNLLGFNLHF